MKRSTPLFWALAALILPSSSRADVIWEANTSRGLNVFEGLERGQGTIDIVNDPKGIYGQVYHYNILDDADDVKDRVESRGHKLTDGTNLLLTRGNTYYVGWRALWDRNVGTQAGKWVALWQMHAYGGVGMGAPFVFRTLGDGRLYLQNNVVGTNQHIWSTPLVRETWQRFVLRFHLDSDASRGWVELWYNGVPQRFINGETRFSCPTHEDDAGTFNKLKWGIYRTGSASGVWHAYMSRARIGTTFADVDPDGGTGGGSIGVGRTQAEDLTKTGYETNTFEGVTCARATSTSLGSVRGSFGGSSGTYTVRVRYLDEDDGAATFRLSVGGASLGSWTADVDDHTWKLRTFVGVSIGNGAEIRVEGARQSGEHARIDYIEVSSGP
jgi:hypothetical protein